MTVFEEFWNARRLSDIVPLEHLGTLDEQTSEVYSGLRDYLNKLKPEADDISRGYFTTGIMMSVLTLAFGIGGFFGAGAFEGEIARTVAYVIVCFLTALSLLGTIYYFSIYAYFRKASRRLSSPVDLYRLSDVDLTSLPALLKDDVRIQVIQTRESNKSTPSDDFVGQHDYLILARKGTLTRIVRSDRIDTNKYFFEDGDYLHNILKHSSPITATNSEVSDATSI